ncbi:hypothetical protein PG993_005204 [Apiospora rasikravindrae]|uniref:DUF7371 domain-containing protein n=1 Tax=Apiospora rasikravindrae TaxID=990691 RepID=A0ABR1TEX7_9PEZI
MISTSSSAAGLLQISAPTPSLGLTVMEAQVPNPTVDLTMVTAPSPVVLSDEPSSDAATQLAAASTVGEYTFGNGPSKRTSSCGNPADSGNFTFGLQDIEPLMRRGYPGSHDPRPVPLLSPYHRFWFSEGIEVVKSQSSGKLVLQYLQPAMDMTDGPDNSANFSTVPKQASDCFTFNLYGIRLGCSSSESECIFTLKGHRLDAESLADIEVAAQIVHVPACSSNDCNLQSVTVFNFKSLTSVSISLKVGSEDQMWWADEVALGWSDNSCEKAACRSEVHDTIRSRDWKTADKKWRRWIGI